MLRIVSFYQLALNFEKFRVDTRLLRLRMGRIRRIRFIASASDTAGISFSH